MWPFPKHPNLVALVERYVMPNGYPTPDNYMHGPTDYEWFTEQYKLLRERGWRLVRDQEHKCPRCGRRAHDRNNPPTGDSAVTTPAQAIKVKDGPLDYEEITLEVVQRLEATRELLKRLQERKS